MRKAIILVAFMVIGISGAWEETNYLNYQFQKVIDTQAGENLEWFSEVQSSADFHDSGPRYYGNVAPYISVSNYVKSVYADQIFYEGQSVDTKDVLTQYGSAILKSQSPDLQTPGEVMSFGSATAGQNMALSGLFNYVQFWGDNHAEISLGSDAAYTHNKWDDPARYPSIRIWANDDFRFTEANMGTEATIGLEKLMAPGAIPTLSGGYNAWGSFDGAYDPTGSENWHNNPDIRVDLSKAGDQGFGFYSLN